MDAVVAANLDRYADGADVARYLETPYHARRVSIGVGLLLGGLRTRVGRSGAPGRPVVADLGAGSPVAGRLLHHGGVRVVTVDLATPAPAAAVAAPVGTDPAPPLVRADLTRPLPFRAGALDGIFAGEVIEHVFDPVALLTECRRVLAPGAPIVLTTPNLAALTDRIRFLAGRGPRQVDALHPYLKLHIRPFTYRSLARTLTVCGFTPTALRSNCVQLGRGPVRLESRALARIVPSVGGSLIVAAVSGPSPAPR